MTDKTEAQQVENIIPVLTVKDLEQSIRFYTETLEFKLDWGDEKSGTLCSVSKDGHSIMLAKADNGPSSSCVWIGLEDDTLFELYTSRGVRVVQAPKNRAWAYEMKIADLDENVLWLGTGPKEDRPIVA